ncbi:restriction endonuclease subunit S [Escherichia fergusonii]|nr:restriction endonuclease subunit S [Escherichia fergusonii]
MSDHMFQIPEPWEISKLPEIADINMGQSPSSSDVNEHGEGIVFFQGKAEFGKLYPTPKKYCTKPTKIASAGDILLSVRAPVGPTNLANQSTAIGRGLAAISAYHGLMESRYLLYFFKCIEPWLSTQGTGSTFKAISGQFIRDLQSPVPPLAEQKVIAEKLDTLLAQVDSTKARLEQIPQILKRFRQAVLRAAMNGTLMGLKESRPHPLCKQWQWPEVPSTWSVLTYSELVDSRLGKMLDKVKNIGSPIKYLGNVNVRWFSFNLENLQEILISESERSELILKYGDILICEGGEPGRCAIWTESDKTPIVFQKALHRARVREKIIPEWLVLNLKNDSNNLTLSQLFTGTTIKHLTGKALAKYPLRVPPVYEQREIVRRVEQLFAYADTIEKQVNNALARVNNLTQSILAKAFRGELTAQWRAENPELISGENSAAALLEKIKAERAASGGKKASRKKS